MQACYLQKQDDARSHLACHQAHQLLKTGAQNVLRLNWRSSTRLVIHFGDYPCHGTKYHDFTGGVAWDAYPNGDPKGD